MIDETEKQPAIQNHGGLSPSGGQNTAADAPDTTASAPGTGDTSSAGNAPESGNPPLPRRRGALRRILSDPHQRPLVIGAATLGVGVIAAAVILLMPAQHSEISQAGQAAQMHPVPGGPGSPHYEAQLAAYNAQQATRAAEQHQSELPTMGQLHKVAHPPKVQPVVPHSAPPPARPEPVRYGPNPNAKAIAAEIDALITENTAATVSAYRILPNPDLLKVRAQAAPQTGSPGTRSYTPPAHVLANTGHISFAVLDTAIKSTEPGPVLATIETGRFAGARLLGGFVRVHDRVLVKFGTMNWQHRTIPITATAITLATARTALATSVNRHTLYRYGWLIGASLLQGVNDAMAYANTNTYLTGSGLGVITHQLSNGQLAMSAIGNVGQTLTPIMAQRFNTPPTVRERSGTGIGVLFMAPVKVPGRAG